MLILRSKMWVFYIKLLVTKEPWATPDWGFPQQGFEALASCWNWTLVLLRHYVSKLYHPDSLLLSCKPMLIRIKNSPFGDIWRFLSYTNQPRVLFPFLKVKSPFWLVRIPLKFHYVIAFSHFVCLQLWPKIPAISTNKPPFVECCLSHRNHQL